MMATNQQVFERVLEQINLGDCVYITGSLCNHRIVEDLALSCWRKGALPYFTLTSFAFHNALLQDNRITSHTLRKIPPALLNFYQNTDAVIIVEPVQDTLAINSDQAGEKGKILEHVKKTLFSKVKNIQVIEPFKPKARELLKDPEFYSISEHKFRKLKKAAKILLKTLDLKYGDFISIKGGLHALIFLEEIALEGLRRGVYSFISAPSDHYKINFLGDPEISCETIGTPLRHETEMMNRIDARILVDPAEDPNFRDKIDKEQVDLAKRGSRLVISREPWLSNVRKKKYIFADYPTHLKAKAMHVPYEELEQIILDGILSTTGVRIITDAIAQAFNNAKKIHVKDDHGSNFWVMVKGRKPFIDDGRMTSEKQYLNFPCGEIGFPVHETIGEGTFFCPKVQLFTSGLKIEDLTFEFKQGMLMLDSIRCKSPDQRDKIIKTLKEAIEEDKKGGFNPIRTTNICELGIGTNNGIHHLIGTLGEEKMLGTVHLAIGRNDFFGGTSASINHQDFISASGISLTVEYQDGSKALIFDKGEFIGPTKVLDLK